MHLFHLIVMPNRFNTVPPRCYYNQIKTDVERPYTFSFITQHLRLWRLCQHFLNKHLRKLGVAAMK